MIPYKKLKSITTPIFVSACLLGVNCRYDGANCRNAAVIELAGAGVIIPICPEQLGGLRTPRVPCCIAVGTGADVLNGTAKVTGTDGDDYTPQFLKAVREIERLVRIYAAKTAILKQRSPSCGFGQIYHGDKIVSGNGVVAAKLVRLNFTIYAID